MMKRDPLTPAPEPGEPMNVRQVHEVIVREWRLPGERRHLIPWWLHLLYGPLVLWAVIYLASYTSDWRWSEYEHRPGVLAERMAAERAAPTPAP